MTSAKIYGFLMPTLTLPQSQSIKQPKSHSSPAGGPPPHKHSERHKSIAQERKEADRKGKKSVCSNGGRQHHQARSGRRTDADGATANLFTASSGVEKPFIQNSAAPIPQHPDPRVIAHLHKEIASSLPLQLINYESIPN